jgi:SAM-dependent methyltransferase
LLQWLSATFAVAVTGRLAAAQQADVPYVPTPSNVVDAMLEIAGVGPGDFVIDLGSGDGRIVIAAASKRGASGLGVEIEGALVNEARREAARQGVAKRVEFREENLFITDIRRATTLTLYLYPRLLMQLRPRFFAELRPGTRIVSHDFDMENWRPDAHVTVPVPDKPYGPPRSEVYLWIVPANAAGRWRWRSSLGEQAVEVELLLNQTFQMLDGEPRAGGVPARLEQGRVRGNEVEFTLAVATGARVERQRYAGVLTGDALAGTVRGNGREAAWSAVRVERGSIRID